MPRITIDLPSAFNVQTEMLLREEHINSGKHLDNAKLLTLISEACSFFWNAIGYSPLDIEGLSNIVADMAIEYKSQAFLGEIMQITFACKDFHSYGFDLMWRVRDKVSQREVARGKHGILCFDYQTQKVCPMPTKLRTRLNSLAVI